MRKSWLTASLLALTVASPFAAADIQGHKAGDFIIRGGFATVDPDDSSSDIKLDGAKQRGTKATVDSDTKASINGPSALGVNKTKVDVDVDPWVYMIGFGYKF
ncbi:TPA: hypothetical protein SL491_004142 [Pseudomonas aeruginosa]|nr:hypothetical protein [Pseudomonas aeruginosa]